MLDGIPKNALDFKEIVFLRNFIFLFKYENDSVNQLV